MNQICEIFNTYYVRCRFAILPFGRMPSPPAGYAGQQNRQEETQSQDFIVLNLPRSLPGVD